MLMIDEVKPAYEWKHHLAGELLQLSTNPTLEAGLRKKLVAFIDEFERMSEEDVARLLIPVLPTAD